MAYRERQPETKLGGTGEFTQVGLEIKAGLILSGRHC
jgi:hypothetical protein